MSGVLARLLLRRLGRERGRSALTVLGVALGVSVFVAIRLASRSALESFADTVDAVAGRANLTVAAVADGFDERLYAAIRATPGVRAAAPVVQVSALARAGGPRPPRAPVAMGSHAGYDETVLVLGLDPFAEGPFRRFGDAPGEGGAPDSATARAGLALLTVPNTVAITRTLAARDHLAPGDTLTVLASGAPVPLVVAAVTGSEALQQAMGGDVVLTDIATAQDVFARAGRLDRVDLIVAPAARAAVRAALAARLPAAARPELPRSRTRQVENLVAAFALNLTALAFIAVFVAAFLVFNAVALSVVRQRRDLGLLRALGLTRAGVVRLVVGEGLALGLVGGALGAALGALLANLALRAVGRTLTDLYLIGQTSRLRLDPGTLAAGFALGVGAALVSALAPALEAASTPAAATLREGTLIEARRPPYARLGVAGAALLALAAATALWTVRARHPFGGFVAAFLVLAGFSLLAPAWTLLAERAVRPLARRGGIAVALGTRAVRAVAARASVVVAALMVAVGMLVALSVMVGSFRRTVDVWITQTLRGDLYVEPVGHRLSQRATALPPALVDGARRLPGVAAVDTYRATAIVLDGRLAQAVGIDFEVQADRGNLQFTSGEPARAVFARALSDGGAVVTESFARRHRVRAGDTLALPAPAGLARVRVEGVFYDYSTDAGAVVLDRRTWARLWRDDRTESMALYLAPGADRAVVRRAFLALAGPGRLLYVTPNEALRRRVLTVFDQTFQITWALQAIAVVVAVLGVISTLTTLVLQRGRELAVLRAAGARRAQVRAMVLAEGALLGGAGSLLGCAAGLALALLLVHVINRQYFGWTIRFVLDPWVLVRAVALMTATATLAGLAPAQLAARRVPADAVRVE